jgi:hypothetical protein
MAAGARRGGKQGGSAGTVHSGQSTRYQISRWWLGIMRWVVVGVGLGTGYWVGAVCAQRTEDDQRDMVCDLTNTFNF